MVGTPEEPPGYHTQDRGQESSVASSVDRVDLAVLNLLVFEPGFALWAIDEIVREIGSRIAVEDSLWRLHRASLIHRLDERFVFASRAAARAAKLLDPHSDRVSWTRGSRGGTAQGPAHYGAH